MSEPLFIKNTYRVIRAVKSGGMGTVFEVLHDKLGTVWALKQLKQQFGDNVEARERFRREAFSMARLRHNHIVEVIDYDIEPGFGAFYVMEFIVGADLVKIVHDRGALPYHEVLRIGHEVASALDYAFTKQGLVHRDIKPANILIEAATGRAVVTDFGIAKRTFHDDDAEADLSLTEGFLGTLRYSSPEQLRNEKHPNPRWDIYSFGALLYEMISGYRFLAGMSDLEIASNVARTPGWKHPLEFPEPPPDPFRRLIEGCLDTDAEKRIQSAADVLARLAECEFEAGGHGSAAARVDYTQPIEAAAGADTAGGTFTGEYQRHIQQLRQELEPRLHELEQLEHDLNARGLPHGNWVGANTLRASLEDIGVVEAAGQLGEAVARLQTIGGRAADAVAAINRKLQEPPPGIVEAVAIVSPTPAQAVALPAGTPPPSATTALPPRRSSLPLAAAVALLLALGGGLFVVQLLREGNEPAPTPAPEEASRQAPPAIIQPAIKSGLPDAEQVKVRVSETQAFSIEIDRGDAAEAPPTRWLFDNVVVASNATKWEFTPGPDAARLQPHKLQVRIGRGKAANELRSWSVTVEAAPSIAEAKIPPLQLEPRPRQLASLRFNESQQLELVVPTELRTASLAYKWTVDGRVASQGPTLLFTGDDARLVRSDPVRIVATAHDDGDRSFSYEWKPKIMPPVPKITASSPPSIHPLEVEPGSAQTFEVTAAPPIGNQALTYVYETNGKETRSPTPQYQLLPGDAQEYTIVASISDNYGQRSQERTTWKVAATGITSKVERWLQEYRDAFNRKDIAKLGDLTRMSAEKAKALEGALKNQRDLRVSFTDVHVEKLGTDQARAAYRRVDEFTNAMNGAPVSLTTPVEQRFRLVDGRLTLEAAAR